MSSILASIKPKYAEAILEGQKKVELRRTSILKPVDNMLIYATAPISMIVGWAGVETIIRENPIDLYQRCIDISHLSKDEYEKYFNGANLATGIFLKDSHKITPMPINSLFGIKSPPQSFCYITDEVFQEFCRMLQG
jgi:predicted transcriptional regulator